MGNPYVSIKIPALELPEDTKLGDEFGFSATLTVVAWKKRIGGEIEELDCVLQEVSVKSLFTDER